VKVRLTEQAQEDARRIRRWWRKNRTKAPNRFSEELREVRKRLAVAADEGQAYRNLGGELVRWILLEKSGQHVYYVVREAERLVSVVAIHGAARGSGPDLTER
jgi:plasmid stabilization system protein ParE